MDTYITSTDPNPYSQIIVLSQKVINDAFGRMWQVAQLDPDSPLMHIDQSNRGGDSLKSSTGAPSVQLQVTGKDPMLYYMLRLTKGELFLYLTTDPNNDSHIEWEIEDWVFAFSVTISRKEITKDSPEYLNFKERASLPDSTFSLAQLYIDTSSSTKWNEELSNFGNKQTDFDNLSPEARGTFDTFIHSWLNLMNEKGCNIVGYQAQREETNELNKYEPSFPPTSIDYFCYPWRGENGTLPPKNNQDENTLSYLMMSNFETPPAAGALDYTGAWTDSKNRGAVFCMNRALFWPWMQSVLREVVKGMVPYPDTPFCEWSNENPDLPYSSGMRYHAGDRDDNIDNEYRFTINPDDQTAWILLGRTLTSQASAKNPNKGNDYMELNEFCTQSYAYLKFEPGTERVDLSGSSTFTFRADHQTVGTYTQMNFPITWSVSLAIAAVEDGGLVFNVIKGTDKVTVNYDQSGGMHWETPPADLAADWRDRLEANMQRAFDNVESNLLYALANQHRLYLPAEGSFLMKDPVFNSKGDLLVQMAYNGADPPTPRKRKLYAGIN